MHYRVIATDYDGTLATEGTVDNATLESLESYRNSGGHVILVTGRQLDDLFRVFPHSHLFEGIVAENGAVFHQPHRNPAILNMVKRCSGLGKGSIVMTSERAKRARAVASTRVV